jgi:hypothetical protein
VSTISREKLGRGKIEDEPTQGMLQSEASVGVPPPPDQLLAQ